MTQAEGPEAIVNACIATPSVQELEKRIAVLERKAAREKKARNVAEEQLEKYSLEIYETNQSLTNALALSQKKQVELEYLGRASSDVASELPLNQMIANVVELTGKFCLADYGDYLITDNGEPIGGKLDETWCQHTGWQAKTPVSEFILDLLPIKDSVLLESWVTLDIPDNSEWDGEEFNWILYTNFALAGEKVGWLVLISKDEITGDMLSALSTARGHLVSGILRRLTDVRILKRNVQLQESLEKLEKARRQLIQSEKMASLGQLAAGVAHEINNPVAFIRSNMEVLQEYLNDYKQLHDELKSTVETNTTLTVDTFKQICEKIDLDYVDEDSKDLLISNIEGLNRVKDIVDNLKSFSHAGDESLSEISLRDCVEAALKVTANVFKYEHKIDNQLSESSISIMGNIGQLQQVLVNLFVNAAYAMEERGQLTITHSQENERTILHIKDTGCGMDKETVAQLFTPFFTTKPVGVGTGLGLSVSYAILEAHNAEVTVDSEVGQGTTFNLSFPALES